MLLWHAPQPKWISLSIKLLLLIEKTEAMCLEVVALINLHYINIVNSWRFAKSARLPHSIIKANKLSNKLRNKLLP